MKEKTKLKNLSSARNPLLPAAMAALERATVKAREVARQTKTAIVIEREGRIERITPYEVHEPSQSYGSGSELRDESDE